MTGVCGTCGTALPYGGRGRPRKHHPGCVRTARRLRDGVRRPPGGVCRMCRGPVPAPRRVLCGPVCAARAVAVSRMEQRLRRQAGPAAPASPPGAGELTGDMPAEAVRWRLDRMDRLARTGQATAAGRP